MLGCAASRPDCFGPDSIVAIDAGRIGALRLDLPVDSIRRVCAGVRDTIATLDESRDTAIVIRRPGLRAVGYIAPIEGDEGPSRPVVFDSTTRVAYWRVDGTAGRLPKGAVLTSTWRELTTIYGQLDAFALNGIVYVTLCSNPELKLHIAADDRIPVNMADRRAAVDSVMATYRISAVQVPSLPPEPDAIRTC